SFVKKSDPSLPRSVPGSRSGEPRQLARNHSRTCLRVQSLLCHFASAVLISSAFAQSSSVGGGASGGGQLAEAAGPATGGGDRGGGEAAEEATCGALRTGAGVALSKPASAASSAS